MQIITHKNAKKSVNLYRFVNLEFTNIALFAPHSLFFRIADKAQTSVSTPSDSSDLNQQFGGLALALCISSRRAVQQDLRNHILHVRLYGATQRACTVARV